LTGGHRKRSIGISALIRGGETRMSKAGELKKFACGCMVLVTGVTVVVIGHQEGCSTLERLCEMTALPPDNPHGPENDHRPGNAQMRMTVEVESSAADTGTSFPGFRLSDFPRVT
jgi:hypothetical protein